MECKGNNGNNGLSKLLGLKDNDYLFPIINNFADCLIVILSEEGRLKYYNRCAENITGIPLKKAAGSFYWDIFCRVEEKELFKAFFFNLDPSQYPLEIKAQVPGKAGKNFTISWKYSTLQEPDGSSFFHVLSGIDHTNYEEANEALREISEKYRTIIHVSPVSVITVDSSYEVTSWSSAAEKLLGWTESSVLEKSIFLFFNDRRDLLKRYCKKAIQGKITYDLEITCQKKNKELVHVSLFLAPMRNYKGAVTGIVIIALDITARKKAETELKESEKMLRYLSYHDTLTGVYNRAYYEKEIVAIKQNNQYPTALILIDIDHLKLVNDSLGHDAGDRYLKASAGLIENNLRESDLLARVGGDEFVIVLPQSNEQAAGVLTNRIRRAIIRYNEGLPELPVSFSIGLAVCESPDQSFEDVFSNADSAMYAEKLKRNNESRAKLLKAIFKTLSARDINEGLDRSRIKNNGLQWGKKIGLEEKELQELLSAIDELPAE